MNNGWIKIHRKILEWEWYSDVNTFKLFFHLLIMANHKEKKYRGILVKKGEVMTGQEKLSNETSLSRQNVRTSLERLKSTNEITIKTSSQGSIIQLVNYDKYQLVTSDLTTSQPASNQEVTTNKKEKKEKNNIPAFKEFEIYALSQKPHINLKDLEFKYKSWIENNWSNGNGKKIKNWKSSLLNTLPYINETKNIKQIIK